VREGEEAELERLIALLRSICETAAPTFHEEARATLVVKALQRAGLDVARDAVGNVVAALPGGAGPRVLLAAHLDTVFAAETDVRVTGNHRRLSAPGIGDNSASLSVLLRYVEKVMAGEEDAARPRVTVAATVGEEGLGDLRGIRELMASRAHDFDMVIAVDGHLGTIVDQGVGSKRYRATYRAKGGHSWGDYPSASAVHALGDAIHALNAMTVPREPKSSYNVGQIQGGTSINAIAEEAFLTLDLRSVDARTLARLEQEAVERLKRAAERHRVRLALEQVGDRPTASVDNRALVAAAEAALEEVGVASRCVASSTDANAAMAVGLPAIAFGVYKGGDAHRLGEWLEPASLLVGYRALRALLARLAAP
jgi:tripeptide aminopeptidase